MTDNTQSNVNNTNNNGTHNNNSGGASDNVDIASILERIKALEQDKQRLSSELQMKDQKIDKLTESKRLEMQNTLDSVIKKWLESIETKDATSKASLQTGLENLVKKGDENGIWDVVCCASAAHVARVNELEQMRVQLNNYKDQEKILKDGVFATESSRTRDGTESDASELGKRKLDERDNDGNEYPNDIWSEFQSIMSGS